MGINSTEVAYGFGQLGSTYTTSGAAAIIPPTGKVFVAITVLSAAKFDADGFECETPTKFINGSTTIANDLAAGSETIDGNTSIILQSPYAGVSIYSNGNDKFFIY